MPLKRLSNRTALIQYSYITPHAGSRHTLLPTLAHATEFSNVAQDEWKEECSMRQHASACVRIRQHALAHVSVR
jgi:hypothetical protein